MAAARVFALQGLLRGSVRRASTFKESYVNKLNIFNPKAEASIPVYRVMDPAGKIISPGGLPIEVADSTAVEWYKSMVTLSQMDNILYDSQRMGKISFYMTNSGEEATHIGSASALTPADTVYAQYREAGVLMYRGFKIADFMNQCFSNSLDLGKGRQMPVHYGSNKLNFHTVSSPLATQIPQAAGAAYVIKMQREDKCVICYFGDGAASEGDAHAGLNFAATLECPVIFFCRNNGYAISTPTEDQYRGDGIASRAIGYGMDYIRIDGNDIFAVHAATKAARKLAVEQNRPVLIEAMTYRMGHHSTSDDSTNYRNKEEISARAQMSPIVRLGLYLRQRGAWDDQQEKALLESARAEVLREYAAAQKLPRPRLSEMFEDVFERKPKHLIEQEAKMHEHIAKYPDAYDTKSHAQ